MAGRNESTPMVESSSSIIRTGELNGKTHDLIIPSWLDRYVDAFVYVYVWAYISSDFFL